MTTVQLVLTAIMTVCIGASGLFSGSETAIVALPRERVGQLREKGQRGRRLIELVADTEGTLATLLVANNFVNILGASVAAILTVDLITVLADRSTGEALGPWISTLVVTSIVLVVGEITPKTMAARRPERFALAVAPTIWWMDRSLQPVAKVFVTISRGILRLFGIETRPQTSATEQDILALALMSEEAGEIDASEREILESVFAMADRPVRDVMTPRLEVVALEIGESASQVRTAVAEHHHSRYPVVTPGGTLDDVVGIIYVKDLLPEHEDATIDSFVREPVYIPERMSVLAALHELRRQRTGIGVVLDEHGGVDGIVTVKDLIAELVGEIADEHDPDEPALTRLGDRVWLADGRVSKEMLERELEMELIEGPYSTIGGLYLWLAGKIPRSGEKVEIGGITLTVLRMDRRRIDRIRVEVPSGWYEGRTD